MKKQRTFSTIGIFFYVVAVILLLIACFYLHQTYQLVQTYAEQGQSLDFADTCDVYFTYCLPHFIYAILAYGVGLIMNKLHVLTSVMSQCVDDALEAAPAKKKK